MMTNNIYYYDKSYDMIHMIIYYYIFYAIDTFLYHRGIFFFKKLIFP